MPRNRRSRRTWVTIAVLVLVSITIITLDERVGTHHITSGLKSVASDVFSPIRSGVNSVIDPIGNFFAGAVNYGSLQQDNNKLQAEIGALRQQAATNPYQAHQLQELTALQHLPFLNGVQTTTASVVSSQVSNFQADLQINKGRADGVDQGMPVVGSGGLVGQVTFASHHTAIVTLLTDGQSKVGVQVGPSSCATCWGIAQGEGPGQELNVNYVQPGTAVANGQVLYTNGGTGGGYPPGIPVAKVSSFHQVSGAAQITIHAKPVATVSDLSYVDVVLWEPTP